MTIRATIKLKDHSKIVRLFDSFADLDEWMERHKADVACIEARTIPFSDMRQGRDDD